MRYSALDLIDLLKSCDLEAKIHANAESLSGGQKRKLQMAIGLVGGSKSTYYSTAIGALVCSKFVSSGMSVLLVDEATSGVDPLSRRAIWRALIAVRTERTIVFTTHVRLFRCVDDFPLNTLPEAVFR